MTKMMQHSCKSDKESGVGVMAKNMMNARFYYFRHTGYLCIRDRRA